MNEQKTENVNEAASAQSALNVRLGDTVICMIDEWGSGRKSDFDGTVMAIDDTGVDVIYLSGYRSRNDFVEWRDVLAKLDKRVKRVSVPGTSYEGHFVLSPNVELTGSAQLNTLPKE